MNTLPTEPRPIEARSDGRALVIGGGGSTGHAWAVGVVAGLLEGGLDVTGADVVVGTSSGSTVAAQLTNHVPPADLLAQALTPVPAAAGRRPGTPHLSRLVELVEAARDLPDLRRRIGAVTLEAHPEGAARWRDVVAARLPGARWPERRLLITAVDAETGEAVVLDRDSGVDLVDAVAASTSNGFGAGPYRAGGRWLLDGGYRRNENADLAAGSARVLVLSPFGGRSLHPKTWGSDLATQVAELRAAGSRVETIAPSEAAGHLFSPAAMDLSLRPAAAAEGHRQGLTAAEALRELWE